MVRIGGPLCLCLLASCASEYEPQGKTTDPGETNPDIVADPPALDFSVSSVGTEQVMEVRLLNEGDQRLNVDQVSLGPNAAFTLLTPMGMFDLEPGGQVVLEVAYVATNTLDESWIGVLNDDPDERELMIPLSGGAGIPELMIDPDPLEYGAVTTYCEDKANVYLTNVGVAPLTVSEVSVMGANFELGATPELPVVIAPGDAEPIQVLFTPASPHSFIGSIAVESDDPRGTATSELEGAGEALLHALDSFEQIETDWTLVDMLFYVDQSGSMDGDQANLASNFDLFTAMLMADGIDYHIMVATGDNGCSNGGVITKDHAAGAAAFRSAVSGPGGTWTEAGLTVSRNALREADGGCNTGFLREDAPLLVILVSDEPEQSAASWSTRVSEILTEVPDAVIHAIVGPPGGGGCADPGTGYWEAAAATGGSSLDICTPDWGAHFGIITDTEDPLDTFLLDEEPVPESIEVIVNGSVVKSTWSYDEKANSVVFMDTQLPPPKAQIDISYDIIPDCG
jgi:hypothetical protein